MRPHFIWTDEGDIPFTEAHEANSEHVFAFTLSHSEGECATLKITIQNPLVGFLHSSRKVWGWFSVEKDGTFYPLFYGRLVAAPVNLFGGLVELLFIGRPRDHVAQKEELAESLRELPWFDPIFFDDEKRLQPDSVLEARSARWHFDPVTHVITISDILTGEDGLVEFEQGDLNDGEITAEVSNPPIGRVRLTCTFHWQQRAYGSVMVLGGAGLFGVDPVIASFNNLESAWPKPGSNIGGGWSVGTAQCTPLYDPDPQPQQITWQYTQEPPSPDEMTEERTNGARRWVEIKAYSWHGHTSINLNETKIQGPPGSINIDGEEEVEIDVEYDEETGNHKSTNTSIRRNGKIQMMNHYRCRLSAVYNPERKQHEAVTIEMSADLQELVTVPEDDDIQEISLDTQSVSETVPPSEGTEDDIINPAFPIQDTRRRSYITTERGLRSLEYMMLVGRAALRSNSRAIRISFGTNNFDKWYALSLRKNALIEHPMLFGGQATGKVTSRELSLDGDTGTLEMTAVIECALGKGGVFEPVAGEPSYCSVDYVGADYQQFIGGKNVVADGEIRYAVPIFASRDDGYSFIGGLNWVGAGGTATMQNVGAEQRDALQEAIDTVKNKPGVGGSKGYLGAATRAAKDEADEIKTRLVFTFPNLNKDFETPYEIEVEPLAIPQQYDLGAGNG